MLLRVLRVVRSRRDVITPGVKLLMVRAIITPGVITSGTPGVKMSMVHAIITSDVITPGVKRPLVHAK